MEKQTEAPNVTAEKPDIWAALAEEEATVGTTPNESEPTVITPQQPRPKPRGSVRRIFLIVIGLVFVAGVTYGTYYVLHAMQLKNNGTSGAKTNTVKTETVQKAPATSTSTAIDTSLDSIDAGMTQATTDQSDASTAVSDSDKQITVPTE